MASLELAVASGGAPGDIPLVVLHGFTGSGMAMEPLVGELRRTRNVVTVDLVGHGSSPAPTDVSHYAMTQVVDDLWHAIDANQVDLFGYSMGGRVALSAAANKPERVRKLVVLGASAGLAETEERQARQRSDETLADSIEAEGLPAFVDRWLGLPLFASLRELGPDYLASTKAQRCASEPVGLANSLRGTGTGAMPPLHDELRTLATPTLWLAGELDSKYCALGADLAATMPMATFEAIADAGHAAHAERPLAVAQSTSDFLGS